MSKVGRVGLQIPSDYLLQMILDYRRGDWWRIPFGLLNFSLSKATIRIYNSFKPSQGH